MQESFEPYLTRMEGRTYIIGREGHIYISDPAVSKHHAEISIIDSEIYLRDLGSTNGTFLVKNKQLIHFKEGFVNPRQPVVIGSKQFLIKELLEIVGEFTSSFDEADSIEAAYG